MTDYELGFDGDITELLQSGAKSGKKTVLPPGRFLVTETILLHDDAQICGHEALKTTLVMADGLNNNMFTNAAHRIGNSNITLQDLEIWGNQKAQWKPDTERRLSFCNAVYLANVQNCRFDRLDVKDMLQTALHFRGCRGVLIDTLHAENLGWSGISTSGTDNLVANNITIINSGNDHRHSAVHLDGGNCAFVKGVVRKCVGNGIMLDSTFSQLQNCVVQVEVGECMRGIALIGSGERQTRAVSITNSRVYSNEIGIMVSNSHSAFAIGVSIEDNAEVGVLFQGRAGGRDSFVVGCKLRGNKEDFKQIHESRNNFFIENEAA